VLEEKSADNMEVDEKVALVLTLGSFFKIKKKPAGRQQ